MDKIVNNTRTRTEKSSIWDVRGVMQNVKKQYIKTHLNKQ